MKITILNGNPAPSKFDRYLVELKNKLEFEGATVNLVDLRSLKLRYCIGCFGCWVKTPGVCSSSDESCEVRRAVIHSDFTLWAAPLKMGFPSALLKMSLDKSIPLLHPYFVVDRGEAHHRKRYPNYPRVGLLVEPETDTDDMDLRIIATVFSRTAVNMKSRLEFVQTTDAKTSDLAQQILVQADSKSFVPVEKGLAPIQGEHISPPRRLVLFNGSPRGRRGNTPIMLTQFGEGFATQPGNRYELHNLNRIKDTDHYAQILAKAESVLIGFPLYTDSMPGMVKNFIEALEPLRGRENNPPMGFIVQSGFPEALHSRYVERYLQKLAQRLGSPYLGTIIKGNGEGIRMMPDDRNERLFSALQGLGSGFATTGKLNAELLQQVAGTERYNPLLIPVFKLFVRLPIASWYWDMQLKQNGAYEQRFAQPYAEGDVSP